jgi:hypothetical protein
MYYNLICIFTCTPICTKSYSCKKWVLHPVNQSSGEAAHRQAVRHCRSWFTVNHPQVRATTLWTKSTKFFLHKIIRPVIQLLSFYSQALSVSRNQALVPLLYTEAPGFCSNYNLALSFRFYLISNPWTLGFSP